MAYLGFRETQTDDLAAIELQPSQMSADLRGLVLFDDQGETLYREARTILLLHSLRPIGIFGTHVLHPGVGQVWAFLSLEVLQYKDELRELVPVRLMLGLPNPAPPPRDLDIPGRPVQSAAQG